MSRSQLPSWPTGSIRAEIYGKGLSGAAQADGERPARENHFFVVNWRPVQMTGHFPSRQPRSNQLTDNLLWSRLS